MAGIGFELRRLRQQGGIFRPVASAGHAAAIGAGPWILTVVALSIIQRNIPAGAGSYTLQALVIYIFCFSLLISAPIIAVALRLTADDLYTENPGETTSTYLSVLLLCAATGGLLALVIFGAVFSMSQEEWLAATLATSVTSAIWPAIAFSSTVKNYVAVTSSFVVGLGVSVVGTITATRMGWPPPVQILAFTAGLWVAMFWLTMTILHTFAFPVPDMIRPLKRLLATARRHRALIAGSLIGVMAIWIDSWIMWMGPHGLRTGSGLPTSPVYDSAMFTARLTMLPGLIFFLTSVETGVFENTRAFMQAISGHATHARIEAHADRLRARTMTTLHRLILAQAVICIVTILLVPVIIPLTGLYFHQSGIFRFGCIGALFHVIFFSTTSLYLYFGRERSFLALQIVFLILNGTASFAAMQFGHDYLGFGYLAAAALSAIAALWFLETTFGRLLFLVFSQSLRESRTNQGAHTPSYGNPSAFNTGIQHSHASHKEINR